MNTLSRTITAHFFPNLNSYNILRKHWSVLISSERKHELSAAHHLLYLALIGKDWRKAFSPLTNQRKLDNGAFWDWGLFRALHAIQVKFKEEELLAPFDGLVTSQIISELRNLLPTANAYAYRPADFANQVFPFDAYTERDNANTNNLVKKESSNG